MEGERPSAASTLPRSFMFRNYSDGDAPKTPERETPPELEMPMPEPPRSRYVIKRKKKIEKMNVKCSVGLGLSNADDLRSKPLLGLGLGVPPDEPLPTIETPDDMNSSFFMRSRTDTTLSLPNSSHFLASFQDPRTVLPRTPSPQITCSPDDKWSPTNQTLGIHLARPMSGFSLPSDSSDNSDIDSDDDMSLGDSMTSPDSDVGYMTQGIKQGLPATRLTYQSESPSVRRSSRSKFAPTKEHRTRWNTEMDNHLWTCYLRYMNDPTVTPFKNWPGSAPPLGVCRRVAREAKATWKGPKVKYTTSERATNKALQRDNSSDTLIALKSGSNTPTGSASQVMPPWPKSSNSTRKRLREICKQRAVIAPHYQRMLKSRSPEPFPSSNRGSSHRPRFSSPETFATRDVRLSLATSTSITMQPHGPLQQITREPCRPRSNSSWFNDPSVAWASPPPQLSSDMRTNNGSDNQLPSLGSSSVVPDLQDTSPNIVGMSSPSRPTLRLDNTTFDTRSNHSSHSSLNAALDVSSTSLPSLPSDNDNLLQPVLESPPRLGSPFHHHTWTASNVAPQRPQRATRNHTSGATASFPRLRSPFEINGTFPYPGVHKRRAQSHLEEDTNAVRGERRHSLERDIFYDPPEAPLRRVRARGFSYGDALTQGRLPTTHTPPPNGSQTIHRFTTPPPSDALSSSSFLQPGVQPESIQRLASPFAGISSRPSRNRRVSPTIANPLSQLPNYPSIDEALNQTGQNSDRY